jgi:hypothetical protein
MWVVVFLALEAEYAGPWVDVARTLRAAAALVAPQLVAADILHLFGSKSI